MTTNPHAPTLFDAALADALRSVADPRHSLSDGGLDLIALVTEYGDERVADERNETDSALAVLERIERELFKDESVREQMRTALLCAANVLTLLEPEVKALGCRAVHVPALIRQALDMEEA